MIYTFENYQLDVQRRELRRGSDAIPLEPGVFDLLQYLVSNRQRVLSKDDLIAAVWNGRIISESTLSGRINAVRSALADDGGQQRLLRTFPRKGFRFVGEVHEQEPSPPTVAPAPAASADLATTAPCDARESERRQLTIMACDVVGLATLSARLDPEELREIVAAFHDRVRRVVERHEGFVARLLPEGVLAYFGYPHAHEDDAERAVRAALAAVSTREPGRQNDGLRARAGVAAGLVVIDGPDHGATTDRMAIGETPLLASRMLALAAPGTVVIAAGVRRLVGKLFEYRGLAADGPGSDGEAAAASQVLGEAADVSRFAALRGIHAPRLVGRDEPIEMMLRRWSRAQSGAGELVLLAGEPGIGKSRLIAEFEARVGSTGAVHYSCQPHWRENALGPVVAGLETELKLASTDPAAEKSRKIHAALEPMLPAEDVALIAALLGAAGTPQPPHLDLGPQRNRSRTFAALGRWIVRRARAAPLLMVVEDAHWADPSSLEFFDGLVALLPATPLLLVMSSRPEFAAPWVGNANTTLLTLARLSPPEAAELARQVADDELAPAVVERIVAQADGIPLFVEELTMAVRDAAGRPGEVERPSAVPATLQASLMARLDRLRAGKKVAQIGAVIGRVFSSRLLAAVAAAPETELAQGLAELVASGLVHARGAPPDASYVFKHALVQEAAYESLLRGRRADIHGAVVAAAEAGCGEIVEASLLGHHCAQAGLTAKAASYYRLAGEQAAARSAGREMRQQFERALAHASSLPPGPDRDHLECELLLALGHVLLVAEGNADTEALAVFERAGALCRKLNDSAALTRALYSQASILVHRGDPRTAQILSDELLSLGHAGRNSPARMAALVRAGHIACLQGRFAAARKNLSEALAMHGSEPSLAAAAVSSPDRTAAAHLALALTCQGESALAARQIGAIGQRQRAILPSSLIVLLTIAPPKNAAALRATAEEQQSLADEHGFPYFSALARCLLGWTRAQQDPAEGLCILTDAFAALQALSVRAQEPWALGLLSDALALTGRHAEALATVTAALASSQATGIAWFDAELHRRKAQLLLQTRASSADAERALRQAVHIAREQSAKLFEQRAGASLAELRKSLVRSN